MVLIFSQNRPLQLDLTINSFNLNCKEREAVAIYCLYKTTSNEFEKAYKILIAEHPDVNFVKEVSFKKDTISIFENYKYVLFCTDDTIFVRKFYPEKISKILEKDPPILGCSLRLGMNALNCYPLNRTQDRPKFDFFQKDYLLWDWTKHTLDWGYPLEVSSSLYRTDTIKYISQNTSYNNPNVFEWVMDASKNNFAGLSPLMITYMYSIAFSAPINKVSPSNGNRCGGNKDYSIESLLDKYMQGKRVSAKRFRNFVPSGAHEEIDLRI